MNDLIEKLEERYSEAVKASDQETYTLLGSILYDAKTDPAITAREKAKKVAECLLVGADAVLYTCGHWWCVRVSRGSYTGSSLCMLSDDFEIPTPEEIPYAYYPVQ